jgi:hypothetical protein
MASSVPPAAPMRTMRATRLASCGWSTRAGADIPGEQGNPAPAIFSALAGVIAPANRPG